MARGKIVFLISYKKIVSHIQIVRSIVARVVCNVKSECVQLSIMLDTGVAFLNSHMPYDCTGL
jgi:hypothetical protein